MVSLRSGKAVKVDSVRTGNVNSNSTKPKQQKPSTSSSRKRKAPQPELESEPKVETEQKIPSTPPPTSKTQAKPHEKTPGRVGPIRRDSFCCTPDIKPFKGPPGKKVRKTAQEKEDEYSKFALENEGHNFHELHVCFDKGPKGSPTYDKAGFELDFGKVARWMQPEAYNKQKMINNMDRAVDQAQRDQKIMANIFFEKGGAPQDDGYDRGANHWKDRVSKDLNIPWHKIGVKEFENWDKMGFPKAKKADYTTFSKEENDRMLRMMEGASLRK